MSGDRRPDPLTEHYKRTVRLIEHLVLEKAPRFPWMPPPTGLHDRQVAVIAAELAAAHRIAAEG